MDDNNNDYNIIENIVIISLRKETYILSILKSLEKRNTNNNLKERIKKIIVKMDPILFVSDKEREIEHLINNTCLEDLDREKIAEELKRNLKF